MLVTVDYIRQLATGATGAQLATGATACQTHVLSQAFATSTCDASATLYQ